ncbi:MAG: hypothetical protein LUD27_06090 [Clostridia bacterium]|nr:hypothetical protein [Clostridia bacterium]
MDGVLADFNRGVKELCNIDPLDQANASEKADDAMWAAIRDTPHFYDRLEFMPGAKEMFDYTYNHLGDDCQILSAVPKAKRGIVTAGDDKISWVHRLLGENVKVNIVYKEQKKDFCMGNDCILVDDLASNITAWEGNGGTGILHIYAKTTLTIIREMVAKYKN